ncbi:MAG: hypothetical protein QOD47_2037 [Gemmatimonadaceae bacterium]|jgi:hypothetical protein|nr:hypothetical protein [Gemmatimonadaceae bacterium]
MIEIISHTARAAILVVVLAGCSTLQAQHDAVDTPTPAAAKEDCTLQQMASASAGVDAAAATSTSPDSAMGNLATQSRAAIATIEYQSCVSRQ